MPGAARLALSGALRMGPGLCELVAPKSVIACCAAAFPEAVYTEIPNSSEWSDEDVEKAFKLYQHYTDVVGYSKVVTLADLEKNGYTLAVNAYIEKPPAPPIDPVKVKQEYFAALDNVKECEERLYQLLKEGGYLE